MVYPATMNQDRINNRIDEAVLALLHLGIFERHPVTGAVDALGAGTTCA